jgi:hypothetical protein
MTSKHPVFWLALLVVAGCSKESQEDIVAPKPNPALARELAAAKDPTLRMARAVTAGKPGADVDVKYDILSKPEPGVPSEVKLAIITGAPAERLTYKITGMPGLTLAGTLEGTVSKVTAGQVIDSSFSLLPDAPGIYYASVTVMTLNAGSEMGRTFSVPLLVGDVAAAQKPAVPPKQDAKGQAIEPMKAEEN